jgi:hypothetical protein
LDYVIVKELNRFHDTIPASFEKTEGNCGWVSEVILFEEIW